MNLQYCKKCLSMTNHNENNLCIRCESKMKQDHYKDKDFRAFIKGEIDVEELFKRRKKNETRRN